MVVEVLRYILLVIEVVVCLLLIGVVLLQKSKQQGAGMAFGAGVGESLFGAQVTTVLTKATVVLAIVFLLNTTILAYIGATQRARSVGDEIDGVAVEQPASSGQPGGEYNPPPETGTVPPMDVPAADTTIPVPVE